MAGMAGASCLGGQEAAECAGVVTSFQQQVQGTGVLRARREADVGHPAWGFSIWGPAAEGACHAEGSWQQPAARRPPQPTPPHTARSAEPGKLGQWLQGPVGCRPPLQGSPSLWVPGKPWSKVEMVTNIVG